jgi:hypothetical protein
MNTATAFTELVQKMLFQEYRTATYEPLESNLHGGQRNAI